MAVEARLSDQDPRPVSDAPGQLGDAGANVRQQVTVHALRGGADPGGGAVIAKHVPQYSCPFARRGAGPRRLDGRRHDVRRRV
jgi:hypothetical protein